jgi:hypothetical protein
VVKFLDTIFVVFVREAELVTPVVDCIGGDTTTLGDFGFLDSVVDVYLAKPRLLLVANREIVFSTPTTDGRPGDPTQSANFPLSEILCNVLLTEPLFATISNVGRRLGFRHS